MVKVRQDLTGMVFGRLKVLEQAEDHIQPNGVHRPKWKCQCHCENQTIVFVQGSDLNSGRTQSCGCLTMHVYRYEGDEEYHVVVSKDYYDVHIGFQSEDYKSEE